MANLSLSKIGLGRFPKVAVDYAYYMKSIAMRSELTVCEYMLDLRTFFRYLCAMDTGMDVERENLDDVDISGVTVERLGKVDTDFLVGFVFYLDHERGNKGASKHRKTAALKSFFKYLLQR